jgi:hypothetical protein
MQRMGWIFDEHRPTKFNCKETMPEYRHAEIEYYARGALHRMMGRIAQAA